MRKLLAFSHLFLLLGCLALLPFLYPTPELNLVAEELELEEELVQRVDQAAGRIEAGVAIGFCEGVYEEVCALIPSFLTSAKDLWAGMLGLFFHPKDFSYEIFLAYQHLTGHTATEILLAFAPEIRELSSHYQEFDDFQRGRLVGRVLGRYGVDFFSGAVIAKTIRAYAILKKAGPLLKPRKAPAFLVPSLHASRAVHQFAGQGAAYLNEVVGVIGYMEMVGFKENSIEKNEKISSLAQGDRERMFDKSGGKKQKEKFKKRVS